MSLRFLAECRHGVNVLVSTAPTVKAGLDIEGPPRSKTRTVAAAVEEAQGARSRQCQDGTKAMPANQAEGPYSAGHITMTVLPQCTFTSSDHPCAAMDGPTAAPALAGHRQQSAYSLALTAAGEPLCGSWSPARSARAREPMSKGAAVSPMTPRRSVAGSPLSSAAAPHQRRHSAPRATGR